MDSTGLGRARRKACVICYEKKIRCDYSLDTGDCSRCRAQGLECVLPAENEKPSRSSLRSDLEKLTTRVHQLERSGGSSASEYTHGSGPGAGGTTVIFTTPTTTNPRVSPAASVSEVDSASIKTFRGSTTPWETLVSQVGEHPSLVGADMAFREDVRRLAEDERTIRVPRNGVVFRIQEKMPQVTATELLAMVWEYARDAPYPIVWWESVIAVATRLLDAGTAGSHGEVVCILIYIIFGTPAHAEHIDSGLLFNMAWNLLPPLILDNSLWSLKAVTLMVHYLQADSKPEQCWTLLGTALRMAVSLGFHRDSSHLGHYSAIEAEEGRRAWWLCYIMEKTMCTTLGYPSFTSALEKDNQADLPRPFVILTPSVGLSAQVIAAMQDNEDKAAGFFMDLITLTRRRQEMLEQPTSASLTAEQLNEMLRSTLRDGDAGLFAPSPEDDLRRNISDLAHYNAIQVIGFKMMPRSPPLHTSVVSARASVQIVLDSASKGTTLCLWMWLYYSFTAAVVLFLNVMFHPEDPDTVLDLAILSDLERLCATMADSSPGARRIRDVARHMERVAFQLVKETARGKSRKRSADDSPSGSSREKRGKTEASVEAQAHAMPELTSETDILGEDFLNTMPPGFNWDDWDQWLADVPPETE